MKHTLVLLSIIVALVQGQCPWQDATLTKASTVAAWNTTNAAINIPAGTRYLLDFSPPKLANIIISGDLVVNNANINLDVNFIRVNNGGKFIIGGEGACQITNKVIVTLFGPRPATQSNTVGVDPVGSIPFGDKGLAVATGGTFEVHGKVYGPSWTRLAQNVYPNQTRLYLETEVNWRVGSKIVLASTDFGEVIDYRTINASQSSLNWQRGNKFADQSEVLTIKAVNGKIVDVEELIQYLHWGQDYEKAEVGLLTRQVVFQGDNSSLASEYGGHIMMRPGTINIEGAEFTRLGQRGVLGRYPVHFHLLKTAGNGIYVRDNSIHDNFQRCLVLHDTSFLSIKDNVAYNTIGHCYFLEDGPEQMNVLDHNLGIRAVAVARGDPMQIILTDDSPSIFWITNPNNTFINNAAVGGRFGYWFLMPEKATGAAAGDYADDPFVRPRCQQLLLFKGNVAHSTSDTGIQIDDFLTPTGDTEATGYTPRNGPFDPTKACGSSGTGTELPVFYDTIAYKHREHGIWGKSNMRFVNSKILDNKRGFMVNGYTILEDSLIVGESDNVGTPASIFHTRSYPPLYTSNATQIQGHETYDNGGPQYSRNNVFVNFTTTSFRKANALGSLLGGPFALQTMNRVMNLTYINANEVHLRYLTVDAQYGWTILDTDGTTTGTPGGGWIVSNVPMLVQDSCTFRPEWNASVCPPFEEGYNQVAIVNLNGKPSNQGSDGTDYPPPANSYVVRGKFTELGEPTRTGPTSGGSVDCPLGYRACQQYSNNVISRRGYQFKFVINEFDQATPGAISIGYRSNAPGDWVVFAFPYPPTALPFNVTLNSSPFNMTQVYSMSELGKWNYYYDTTSEHLYVMLINEQNQKAVTQRWNLTNYNSQGPVITIKAACESCAATKLTVPGKLNLGNTVDKFKADLQTCQLTTSPKPSKGVGTAFFWLNPTTKQLFYNILHDLTQSISSIKLYSGAYGAAGTLISTKDFFTTASPLRGFFTLSNLQWQSLVKGELFVQIGSKSYPAGHLRGQIRCVGTCSVPPSVSAEDPCNPLGDSIVIYNDTLLVSQPWSDYSYNSSTEGPAIRNFNSTEQPLCGTGSIKVSLPRGSAFAMGIPRSSNYILINLDEYTHFEFYIKNAPDQAEAVYSINVRNSSSTFTSVRITSQYINNYLIDDNWTRVRIPLVDFKLLPVTNITRFYLNADIATSFYLDQIRLVKPAADEPKTTPLTSAAIVQYDANICVNNGTPPDSGSTASAGGSTGASGGNGGSTSNTEELQDSAAVVSVASLVSVVIALVALLL